MTKQFELTIEVISRIINGRLYTHRAKLSRVNGDKKHTRFSVYERSEEAVFTEMEHKIKRGYFRDKEAMLHAVFLARQKAYTK